MENLVIIGRWLVFIGLDLAALGGLVWVLGHIPGLNQFPGTLRFEGSGFTCVFPLLASIVLSILLTLGLNLIARLFHR